jgi:ABC-type nitrate/sulfonate/bicarbonate transport system ATPase subunit
MTNNPAIEIRGLSHSFDGRPVVEGLVLSVARGEFVSIVGPSGGGKTTVLKVLAGLVVPLQGIAEVDGVSAIGTFGRVAYMPQRDQLLPWRRALDNAILGAQIRGRNPAEARAEAQALFARFGLEGHERSWPTQLSGGMRQRLALLRTFLAGFDTLLLDEPFSALDALTRRNMHTWLQDVWLADQRTVLMVTHDVEEALLLSDRVVVLSPRPAKISAVIDSPFARPRANSVVSTHEFVTAKARVLEALDGEPTSEAQILPNN